MKYTIEQDDHGMAKTVIIENENGKIELSLSELLEVQDFLKRITGESQRPIYYPPIWYYPDHSPWKPIITCDDTAMTPKMPTGENTNYE